jgi:hypothetical protein
MTLNPTGRKAPTAEVLRTVREIRDVQDEWEEFLRDWGGDHDVRQQPFFIINELEFAIDPMEPFVVILRDEGIRCVAPFFVVDRKITAHFGPLEIPAPTTRVLRPFGDRIVHGATSSESENVQLVLRAVAPHMDEFDAIWLPEIRLPGDFWDFFGGGAVTREGFRLTVIHPQTETVQQIKLPNTFEEYMVSLKGDTRRKRKKRLEKLEGACGGKLSLSVCTAAHEIRDFLSIADTIRNNSWKVEVFSPNRWSNEKRIRFHEEIAERGWVRGYVLRCDDKPIAYQLGYRYRDLYVAEDVAYLNEVRSLSPGAGLMLLMLDDLCQNGASLVLLQPTDNELKRSFGNDTYVIGRAVVVANKSRANRLLFGSQRFIAVQHERASRIVRRIRMSRRNRKTAERG